MNIFSDRALAGRFREGSVSSLSRLFYLTAFLFFQSVLLTTYFQSYSDHAVNLWTHLSDGLMILTAIFGTIALWSVNRLGDNREFIERYICLSFPIFFHMLAIAGVVFVALTLASTLFGYDKHPSTTPIHSFVIVLLIYGWYYWRLFLSFRIAAGVQEKRAAAAAAAEARNDYEDDPDAVAEEAEAVDTSIGRTLYDRLSLNRK